MGLVFEGAIATVVAISGSHSNSGLPGISLSRKIQPEVDTNAGTLVSTLQHVFRHISESKYATRGRTYQESFLSRCCLFFTTGQVYFACRDCTRAESILQYPSDIKDPSRETLEPAPMTLKHQVEFRIAYKPRPTISQHVREYTSRSLSYPIDGLRAFQGMLARLAHHSYWGILLVSHLKKQDPVHWGREECTRGFVLGLQWKCIGPIRGETVIACRAGLPTWCWASVVGEIICPDNVWARPWKQETAAVLIEDFDGCTQDIFCLVESNIGEGLVIKEQRRYLHITAFVSRVTMNLAPEEVPSGMYRAQLKFGSSDDYTADLHIDMFTDTSPIARLEQEHWDVLDLVEKQDWLIMEWKDDIAYRVGIIQLWDGIGGTDIKGCWP